MGLGKCLTWNDRLLIERYKNRGLPVRDIAARIHVCEKTVRNELKRGKYEHLDGQTWIMETRDSPDIAQARYDDLKHNHGGPLKIGNDYELARYIEALIKDGDSPAAVYGKLLHGDRKFSVMLCEKTIYNYIGKGVFLDITNKDLPNEGKGKKRGYKKVKASRASKGTSIEERPEEIESREVFGHWEMDCVEGKKRTKAVLLVLTERKTRFEIVFKMPDKTARSVVACLNRLERRYGRRFSRVFKSITVDNGSEFMDVEGIERSIRNAGMRTKVYYCHPYSAWERGSNENHKKMIRRFLPKGSDLRRVTPG